MRDAFTYTYSDCDSYGYSHSYSNSYTNSYRYSNANTNTYTEGYADTEGASINAAAAAIAWKVTSDDRPVSG